VTAIEFGLLAFPLFLLIMAIIEYGLIFLVSSTIESGLRDAARQVIVGDSDRTTVQNIKDFIIERGSGLIDEEFLEVSPTVLSGGTGTYGVIATGGDMMGGADDIVFYRVTYTWQIFTPIIGNFYGQEGVFIINATTMVKNEPF
jgi:hypothetical protein